MTISTASSKNLMFDEALPARESKDYINRLIKNEDKLPICHYEFR